MCNIGDRLFCNVNSHNHKADIVGIRKFMYNISSASKVVIVTDALKREFQVFVFTGILYFVISVWHEMDEEWEKELLFTNKQYLCVHC